VSEPATPELAGVRPHGHPRPRPVRPIAFLLTVAVAVAAIVLLIVRGAPVGQQEVTAGQAVPGIAGRTLDGRDFDLSALRGKPVVINFWGPTCVPCVNEFPLLAAKATQHAADGLVIVGVLTDDPVDTATTFVAQHGGTWSTVIDPDGAIKRAYRVLFRPQTFFVDRNGNLSTIQYGEVTEADFERQYAAISGGG
jgi:thiol-disulfide isomerase/thioredoxin